MKRRIKYFGLHDMGAGMNLHEAEAFFLSWNENTRMIDVNAALELYNIKRYFDAEMRLDQWTDAQYSDYQNKCSLIPGILGKYCKTINDSNLTVIYNEVELDYANDFWALICEYKVYSRISAEALKNILDTEGYIVWHILKHKVLATFFGQPIAEHLMHNPRTANELIFHFLAAHERTDNQLYFPVELTQEMRNQILSDFVDHEESDINCLRLLEQAQSTKEFPVSDRLKLKARRKCDLIQEKLFAGKESLPYGAQVSFKSIPDEAVEELLEDNVIYSAYSREWIEENQDYPTLLNNFIYLFGYIDREQRCSFLSLGSDLGVLERHLGVKGKKDYQTGIAFNVKRIHSMLQIGAYQEELLRLGIRIESLFKWFFEDYLLDEFNAVGFSYTPPSEGTTYAEKCKLLAISIDGVLKQYRLFCEDGYVDRDLLEMSSGHVAFGDLVSMRENKYAYSSSSECLAEQYLLYSDQSMMNYTEKTGSKYRSLSQLLAREEISKDDFQHYQQRDLDWLIGRGVISVGENGYLRIDKVRAFVLNDLFCYEVICPAYFDSSIQARIADWVSAGDLKYENTLFSKPEQAYLNYVLNKAAFSNGMDLRNRYSHDTCSLNEETQKQDYWELLKIMVFIILKINEEFCIKYPLNKTNH